MPAPKVSESEFIQLWQIHKSPAKLARAIGATERSVAARRRDIEHRHGIRLNALDYRSRHYEHLQPVEHNAVVHEFIENGTVLVFSDAHFWPGVRTTAFRALVQFARQLKPTAIVNNGDAFDGNSVSRHPRIMFLDKGPSVAEELQACKDRLTEIEEAAGDATLLWPLGNHDARYESRLAASAPEYEGIGGFHLKDHFPKWAPCWSVWINDEVVIKHRYKGGIHATHLNTQAAGKTMVTGHLHSLKVTPYDDYNGTRWGVDTGTLADPAGPQFVDYLEANPTNWRSGFVVLTFVDGNLMWPEVVRVLDEHHVDFRGQKIRVME